MKELVCIVCPKGCRLQVDEDDGFAVTGNSCPRGAEYGKNELKNPTRVLTSTVSIENALHRRCPVKTDRPIPKGKLFEVMELVGKVRLQAPVRSGDVGIADAAGTGADLIVTKTMDAAQGAG